MKKMIMLTIASYVWRKFKTRSSARSRRQSTVLIFISSRG